MKKTTDCKCTVRVRCIVRIQYVRGRFLTRSRTTQNKAPWTHKQTCEKHHFNRNSPLKNTVNPNYFIHHLLAFWVQTQARFDVCYQQNSSYFQVSVKIWEFLSAKVFVMIWYRDEPCVYTCHTLLSACTTAWHWHMTGVRTLYTRTERCNGILPTVRYSYNVLLF